MDEIIKVVQKINTRICSRPWMDFDVEEYKSLKLFVSGRLDASVSQPDMEIIFEEVFFVSLPFSWKTDTTKSAFEVASEKEIEEVSRKFEVEQEIHIFKFVAEGLEGEISYFIGAKSISFLELNNETGIMEKTV